MSSPPQYTSPPSQYGATNAQDDSGANEPLLAANKAPSGPAFDPTLAMAAQASSSRNAWMETDGDIPDDFKIGVVVMDCDEVIRRAFIRKVYTILLCQLGLTAVVAGSLSLPGPKDFVQNNPWIVFASVIGSFASLAGVYWKRHDFPANMIVLALFTVFESIMVGSVTSYYSASIVLQALVITAGVFLGLTLFTFQTKFDFTSFAPYLFAGIWGLITAGFVGFFLPFNQTFDLVLACFGVLIFSGFILYDTQQIMKRLSVDEAILGSLSLYLDVLNLFLQILRLLSNSDRD